MAEIFLARTRALRGFEKYLVIKKILKHRTNDPDFVSMFLDEARLAATLDHPNIVQIYDVGHVDGEYYIAMEYLRGHSVIEMVRTGARIGYAKPPLEHALSIVVSVCAGLHYAHEKRDFEGRPLEIVHRDVTPQNVVVTYDGAVKLVDFGIAKAATREVETLAGTLKGKVGYMSPEQCRGSEVDRRSDLFTVGILLYELTTGKRLYYDKSDFDTLKRIVEGPVPTPRDLMPFYPAALNAIVVRCLQKDPADRYQTARELHGELEAFIRDQQLITGTVPLAQYMERLYASELQVRADLPGLPLGAAGTRGSSPSYFGEARRNDEDTPLRVARRGHLLRRAGQAVMALGLIALGGGAVWYAQSRHLRASDEGALDSAGMTTPAISPVAASPAPPASTRATIPITIPAPNLPIAPPDRPSEPRAHHHPGEAHISVVSDPPCEVLVDGVPFGMTPLIDARLVGGKHLFTLLNTAEGLRETQRVTLAPGELWTRSFSWREGRLTTRREISGAALARPAASPPEPVSVAAPEVRPQVSDSVSASAAEAPSASTVPPPTSLPAQVPPSPASLRPVPPRPAPLRPGGREIAGFVLDAQRVSGNQPHLPDSVLKANPGRKVAGSYKICVEPDGHVSQVSAVAPILGADAGIMQDLRGWRYQPQSTRVCATKKLTFQVP
jgi:serine/threonine-protein kinase